ASALEGALQNQLAALAQDAQELRALLQAGDVVEATVLPFNGLTDLIEIFGLQVAASLPPNVHPGETLQLEVQGFKGDQILVKLLPPEQAAPPASEPPIAAPPQSDVAELTPLPVAVEPEPASPSPASAPEAQTAPPQAPSAPASSPAAAALRGGPLRPPIAASALPMEARIGTVRAAPPPPPGAGAGATRPAPTNAPPSAPQSAPPLAPRAAYVPIETRPSAMPPPARPIPGAPIYGPTEPNAPAPRPPLASPSVLLADPAALLRTLRIPVTPTAMTFAKLVTSQPQNVAVALRALENGLTETSDPRAQTLRTLAAFVGRLDPDSPTFATQVTSYMSHVVEGAEGKLADAALASQATANPAAATANQTGASAQIAERLAAASGDLKTQLIALLSQASRSGASLQDAETALVENALTAVVTNQLSTLVAQQTQPGMWSFTLPIALGAQTLPAHVRIHRDAPGQKTPLTTDDFHIAFILETPRLGTVAIDMHAVGRAVSVAVKTERQGAAASFKSALGALGERLESLRYNVKSLDAAVAPYRPTQAPPT
ncbi:MAG: flagellar hook-length control protein FliK, partial [Candidatus Eremiobacteraeota bacterium]|nr:flagellar hook-length control protein FliK [Candidatus Eremiobacteraeota bacterium]